ncbi:nuclear transport factor 2 family protein [Sphingobium sp. WCS2017Hpa-17]|uniref:nuclear transport factor 2 family protein n=1 Tax=Sphingobium sp. WCS2017Hpa-17 TaxID=3073638 RepID=UPI002889E6AF|nr:nuclear transport factor 2 family protein [Sphingobium sp. WCS2017Hpa-17]
MTEGGLGAEDYFQIQALVHSYPRRLDSGDLVGLGELFRHAVVHIQGMEEPIERDPAKLTKMFADFLQLYDGKPRTRHCMANLIIEPDGDGAARASCMVVVFQQTPDFPLQPIITGDYQDRFEKIDGQWAFVERHISNDLFGNLQAHGRYAYSPV